MSNLINTYPVFESSQVLTSSQLNQIVSYLDQQSRLTRAKLIGMGIVCGLEISYDDSGSDIQITISKGTAITSEGFLVTLGDCVSSWYRPYQLPEGVQYDPFGDPEQDVTLYELLRETPEDDTGVVPLDDDPGFLDDKFVLLLLETFDNDLKSCLDNTCDELGIDRVFTVRKLLISKEDLDLILTRSANVGDSYPGKFDLPDIMMPRTLFDPEDPHSQDYTAFSEHYVDAFMNSGYTALFGDEPAPGVLSRTYSVYELLLGSVYNFINPFEIPEVESLKNTWTDFMEGTASPGPDYRGIQYFYDFLKDLILGYNEFREIAFDLMSECCPDMSLFPKHIMLGRAVVPNETPAEASKYRHGFTQPPIYNHQKYLIDKTISLHKRLVLMVETFNLERVNNPSEGEDTPPFRMTPSDEKNTPLSKRSIPYYYDSKEEVAIVGDGSLEQYWNFDTTRKKLPGTTGLTLSYENQADDQSVIISPLETPLFYDLDRYPFLRIEGHIGQDYEEVVELINTMKDSFNLAFDTVTLQLDPDASLLELDYSCGFEDLQEEYLIARSTFCGLMTNIMQLLQFVQKNQDTLFEGEEDIFADLKLIRQILDAMARLCELMTDCLDEFDFLAFQKSYKDVLQRILDFLLIEKKLLGEINVETGDAGEQLPIINGLIQRISPVIFRFVDLLFYNTFLRIYYAFKRREYYLQRETSVFSAYIRRNPGIEHQAGVPKGGTFIIVYNNSEDQTVIADFSLPYLCCSTDRCVPMCDKDGDFVFDAPPFARPDYAITLASRPVEINVAMNDMDLGNNKLEIEADENSENDGNIELLVESGALQYTPNAEFTGFDKFQYRIINRETGVQDTGTVTVLVKEPEKEAGCYGAEILTCWGIQSVQSALRAREIDASNMTEKQMVNALLQSLGETRGFTRNEIQSNVLKNEENRRQLLTCIGIPHNANTSYQQLEEMIVDYQNENCGGVIVVEEIPRVELTVNDITEDEIRNVLSARGRDMPEDTEPNELENELSRTTSGMSFSRAEVMLFTKDRITRILRNRNINAPGSANKSKLIDILFGQ